MSRGRKNSGRVENVERAPDMARKPYRSPALVRHGTLQELTQGKGAAQTEPATTVP